MASSGKIEQVVVLKSKFGLEERRIWFGLARLLPDRIVLKGLFYKRIIFLDAIQEVRWSSDLIVLGLFDGEEVELIIQSAALWKFELQARCGLTESTQNLAALKTTNPEPVDPSGDGDGSEVDGFISDLFDSKENPSGGSTPHRESSYRVKTLFAHDRPKKDR